MAQTRTIPPSDTASTAFVTFASQDDQPIFVRLERPATGESLETLVPAETIRKFARQMMEDEEMAERIRGVTELTRLNQELGLYDEC